MKTSFLSLFAFAGIFACALAAPTRDHGAAVDVAVERRDVNIGMTKIVHQGYLNLQKTTSVVNSTVADAKANRTEMSVAVDTIKNTLIPNMATSINNITAEARQQAAVSSATSGVLAELVEIVEQLLFELEGNTLGDAESLLAADVSILLSTLVALVGGLSNASSGSLDGVLKSLNDLLGGLLGGLLGSLGLGGLLQG